ncbi:MAG: DNA-binding protein, partial [Actinomycetota bacterium]
MARHADYTDADIESAIDYLIKEGIPLRPHRVRLRLGGGNTTRIARLIQARSGTLPTSPQTLPAEIADDAERTMAGVSAELHALIGRAWAGAHKSAALEHGTQAEQIENELAQTREELDEAVDEILAAQGSLRNKEAVIHDLQTKLEGEMVQRLRAEGQVELLRQQLEEAHRRQGASERAIEQAGPAEIAKSPPAATTEPIPAAELRPVPNPQPAVPKSVVASPPPGAAADSAGAAIHPGVQAT